MKLINCIRYCTLYDFPIDYDLVGVRNILHVYNFQMKKYNIIILSFETGFCYFIKF